MNVFHFYLMGTEIVRKAMYSRHIGFSFFSVLILKGIWSFFFYYCNFVFLFLYVLYLSHCD